MKRIGSKSRSLVGGMLTCFKNSRISNGIWQSMQGGSIYIITHVQLFYMNHDICERTQNRFLGFCARVLSMNDYVFSV